MTENIGRLECQEEQKKSRLGKISFQAYNFEIIISKVTHSND